MLAKFFTRFHIFVFLSLFLFIILRLPSLFEPNWYGDEGIYQTIGRVVTNGGHLYTDVWDNKPPYLYLLYALGNGSHTFIRHMSLLFGIGTVVSFTYLSKKLFDKNLSVIISSLIFIYLFSIPSIEANIANAENFILLLTISSGLLVVKYPKLDSKNKNSLYIAFSGLLLGISTMFKAVSLFDFIAFGLFLFLINTRDIKKELINIPKKYSPYIIGYLSPIIITGLYFLLNSSFGVFINATLFSNIDYVGYKNDLLFPQSLLVLKSSILIISILFIYLVRNKIDKSNLFIYCWLVFSLYAALFSQRSYLHYMLLVLPSISLLVGSIVDNKKNILVSSLLFILSIFILNFTFGPLSLKSIFYEKPIGYYKNFIEYIVGKKSSTSYYSYFDADVPGYYELSDFLKSKYEGKKIFIWGNSPQVYTLSNTYPVGRFTTAYHIAGDNERIQETNQAINLLKPQIIVIMSDAEPINIPLKGYEYRLSIGNAAIYERVIY